MTVGEAIEILIREIDEDIFVRTEYRKQLHEALNMGIKALEQTRWIPVSERLPEDGQGVLFSIKTEKVYSGIYHKNNKINQWNSANHWYSHQDRSDSRNRAVSANIVIAWMPLPSSYQGE